MINRVSVNRGLIYISLQWRPRMTFLNRCCDGYLVMGDDFTCTVQDHAESSQFSNFSTLKMLIYFSINHGDQRVFPILNYHECLSYLFLIHFNTYVMDLRPLLIFFKCVWGQSLYVKIWRQNLTSTDVRFWRIKTERVKGLTSIVCLSYHQMQRGGGARLNWFNSSCSRRDVRSHL